MFTGADLASSRLIRATTEVHTMTALPRLSPLPSLEQLVTEQAQDLSDVLAEHRAKTFPPVASKTFRRLSGQDAARLLGVAESWVRQMAVEHGIGAMSAGRRSYSLEDLGAMRRKLGATGKHPERYLPNRREGEGLQVIATMNFKGGSGKTTTSAHLLQYLALRGYRVLGVDLDPQASLTALFGIHSVLDLPEGATMYAALRYDEARRPLAEVVRHTYIPGLDFVPGGLELMEFEHTTPSALSRKNGAAKVFSRVLRALESVSQDYDVVVIDCPPQLGYLTLCALVAATSVLITVHPQMLDVMSMTQFLAMTGDILRVINEALPEDHRPRYDWLRYLLTRFEPTDRPQSEMAALLRTRFGPFMMVNPVLKSTAISDAGLTNQTLYEVERGAFIRATFDRALEAVDAANAEIEDLIKAAWGRP